MRRAALDYLAHVEIARHATFAAFETARRSRGSRLVLLTTHAETPYTGFAFRRDDTLLLGRESAGVPDAVHRLADARLRIPMRRGPALAQRGRGGGDGAGRGAAADGWLRGQPDPGLALRRVPEALLPQAETVDIADGTVSLLRRGSVWRRSASRMPSASSFLMWPMR